MQEAGAPRRDEVRANGGRPTAVTTTPSAPASDGAIIEKLRNSKNARKFEDLFDRGVTTAHGGDDSRADLGLLGLMAFYTPEAAQLERLFSASALGRRAKWRDRPDYRRRTIARALEGAGETYDWSQRYAGRAPSGDRHRHRRLYSDGDDDDRGEGAEVPRITSDSFAGMPEPGPPEEVLEGIIVR